MEEAPSLGRVGPAGLELGWVLQLSFLTDLKFFETEWGGLGSGI